MRARACACTITRVCLGAFVCARAHTKRRYVYGYLFRRVVKRCGTVEEPGSFIGPALGPTITGRSYLETE